MRKRQRRQKGSLRKVGRVWIAQWREKDHRRKRTLGKVSKMSKGDAENELAKILTPINAGERVASEIITFWDFVMQVYLPLLPAEVETFDDRDQRFPHPIPPYVGILQGAPRRIQSRPVAELLGSKGRLRTLLQHG